MTASAHRWRVAAGVGVLVVFLAVTGALIPPYFQNMEFQRYLDHAVERTQSPDMLVADVVNKAAQMGLPVRAGDVHVAHTGSGLRVDLIYVIRVDLPMYTVDLHFHPAAGG
jgi:hypothetical protein